MPFSLFGNNGIANNDDNPDMLQQNGSSSGTGTIRRSNNKDILDAARQNAMNSNGDVGPDAGRLTLYANGFLVGSEDAPNPLFFCSVPGPPINEEPQVVQVNQGYMDDIARGVVPRPVEDIVRQNLASKGASAGPTGNVKISLVDKSGETYTPPFRAFKGSGMALGGPKKMTGPNPYAQLSPQPLNFDGSKESTKIQVVRGRERKRVEVNMDTTLAQLFSHILTLFSGMSADSKLNAGGQPPRMLNELDPSTTILDADLKRARITVMDP